MKTISSSNVRKHISKLVDDVVETGEVIAITRQKDIDVLIIKFPREYKKEFSDIANLNAYSESFSFLDIEPELYSRADLKK